MFEGFLSGLEYFSESLWNFREQLVGMLELYFESFLRRNTKAYISIKYRSLPAEKVISW